MVAFCKRLERSIRMSPSAPCLLPLKSLDLRLSVTQEERHERTKWVERQTVIRVSEAPLQSLHSPQVEPQTALIFLPRQAVRTSLRARCPALVDCWVLSIQPELHLWGIPQTQILLWPQVSSILSWNHLMWDQVSLLHRMQTLPTSQKGAGGSRRSTQEVSLARQQTAGTSVARPLSRTGG